MKRVLFYYDNYCGPESRGGTEVATYRIAKALKDHGVAEVYNAFRSSMPSESDSVYEATVKLSNSSSKFKKELSRFIRENNIDVIANMSRFFRHGLLEAAIKESGRKVGLFFMQHFAPGSEMKKSTYRSGMHLLRLNPWNPLYWLRTTFYPLLKMPRKLRLRKAYRDVYSKSDRVILLSEGYVKDYCLTAGITDSSKFTAIPNIFEVPDADTKGAECREPGAEEASSDESAWCRVPGAEEVTRGQNRGKEKRVLILSRMDEIQKRISLALEIWRRIEDDPDLAEWHLDIVGDGHNKDIVKRLIRKLGLENVTYHGWQPREKFLERSAILMMTSEYEGLPLSILEAQAYGCVPIAFDSFASLKDVVIPYETGVVVDNFGDIEGFVKKLTELMYDESYRNDLSGNAGKSSEKFSSSNIAAKWREILT